MNEIVPVQQNGVAQELTETLRSWGVSVDDKESSRERLLQTLADTSDARPPYEKARAIGLSDKDAKRLLSDPYIGRDALARVRDRYKLAIVPQIMDRLAQEALDGSPMAAGIFLKAVGAVDDVRAERDRPADDSEGEEERQFKIRCALQMLAAKKKIEERDAREAAPNLPGWAGQDLSVRWIDGKRRALSQVLPSRKSKRNREILLRSKMQGAVSQFFSQDGRSTVFRWHQSKKMTLESLFTTN